MLNRFSSLILALLLGSSSTLAGTATRQGEHPCEMAGMEMAPAVETIPCCKGHESVFVLSQSESSKCCFTSPQETGLRETAFNLNARYFSIAVTHPEVEHSPLPLLTRYQSSYSQVLLDLQHSYIRNLSFLI
jgi:hypothetical protein